MKTTIRPCSYIPLEDPLHLRKPCYLILSQITENPEKIRNEFSQLENCVHLSTMSRLAIYSKTSMARTLMARYHGCFELVLESLGRNPLAADLG